MRRKFQQYQESIQGFDTTQKRAAAAAMVLSVMRPAITGTVALRGQNKDRSWRYADTAQLAAGMATDMEGKIARRYDAVTELGGTVDHLADKASTLPHHAMLAYRGEQSWARVGLHTARHAGLVALRSYADRASNGSVYTNAKLSGKIATVTEMTSHLFATSPLGEQYPRVREVLQKTAVSASLASAALTGYGVVRDLRRYRANQQ